MIRPWRKIKVKKVSYFAVFNVSADICDGPIQVFLLLFWVVVSYLLFAVFLLLF